MLRLPWTLTAVVLGFWGRSLDEEEAMYRALGGMMRDREDVHRRVRQAWEDEQDALYT
jgi:hypothetical protein